MSLIDGIKYGAGEKISCHPSSRLQLPPGERMPVRAFFERYQCSCSQPQTPRVSCRLTRLLGLDFFSLDVFRVDLLSVNLSVLIALNLEIIRINCLDILETHIEGIALDNRAL